MSIRGYWAAAAIVAGIGCECDDNLGQLNAAIEVDPPSIDFGTSALGATKMATLTVRNRGSFRLTATFATGAPFLVGTSSATVGTFQSVELIAGFLPTELGPHSGKIMISSDDPDQPVVEVPLTGVGIEAAVKVEPAMVDFGEIQVTPGSFEERRTITVSNPGSDSFELTQISLANAAQPADDCAEPFCVDRKSAVRTYAPGDSETFEVTFEPEARAPFSGTIQIDTTAAAAPQIAVPLLGVGVGPEMALCASARGGAELCSMAGQTPKVDFTLVERSSAETGQIRAINFGDRDLTISQVLAVGESGEFTFGPGLGAVPIVVPPNGETSWQVTYAPDDYDFDSFILRFVTDSTSTDAQSLRIEGDVARERIEVIPRGLTFSHSGAVPRGRTQVKLFNCGQYPLEIRQDVTIRQTMPAMPPAFSLEDPPQMGQVIQPQDCTNDQPGHTFFVIFETNTTGQYAAEVDIHSSDPREPLVTVTVAASRS